jgi:hypothetical protein
VQNTGTTTWTAGSSGCTLNIVSRDSLGATQFYHNTTSHRYEPSAVINGGKSVAPGATASFTMGFVAPETPGTYTDTFQLNSASSVYFGPMLTVSITVPKVMATGATNQYDRARAVSCANNYAGYVCPDGYFWTNSSDIYFYGTNAPVPTNLTGDDCAHFVSFCIGSYPTQRGGGLTIPTRVTHSYGEPGAGRLVNTVLIAGGYAKEVFSLDDMEPGDVVGWNWEGDTNITDLDHVTFYLGNGLLASHANSALDVSADTWYTTSKSVRHLVHIFDAPTLSMLPAANHKMVLAWGTNWTSYVLQSSTSPGNPSSWIKVTTTPTKVSGMNHITNSLTSSGIFYRLMMP